VSFGDLIGRTYCAHNLCRPAIAESRLHGVAVKTAQVIGGPDLFRTGDKEFFHNISADWAEGFSPG
jgi:hypothetical protein